MIIKCTKMEFAKMLLRCDQSTSCTDCILNNICSETDKDGIEVLVEITELVKEDEE